MSEIQLVKLRFSIGKLIENFQLVKLMFLIGRLIESITKVIMKCLHVCDL